MLGKRIISTFLLVLMLVSSLSLAISAAENENAGGATDTVVYEYNTNRFKPTMNYLTGEVYDEEGEVIPNVKIDTQEEKLEIMDLRLEQNGYRLYIDEYSGEVAIECIATGDVMFTNPYDVSARSDKELSDDEKTLFLSQLLITYEDTSNNNATTTYKSYVHAVKGGDIKNTTASQINVKYIKNGIRVEYSIGRIDTRYLVPERIRQEKFETMIRDVAIAAGCTDHEARMLRNYFELKDVDAYVSKFKDPVKQEEQRKDFLKKYPMVEDNGPVYVFTGATKKEYKAIETIIKKYCPDYTYEELDSEHLELNYTPDDKNEALFKIALEYTIDENGFSVRLPANGIRFDESIYRLENIEILPFMGAGHNPNAGYTFFPDGSGTLFDFQELAKKNTATYFYGDFYGDDFAYYNLGTGAPHNEVVRYPVFGLKEDIEDSEGNIDSRGFLAVVEEGDAMMMLYSYHSPEYNSVRMSVNPRPYDEYELSDVISVAGDAMWTVVSPRKYTGNFTIRYVMLTDPDDIAAGKGLYETTYVGMAKAYRNYLIQNGVLTQLTAEDIKENIPLYIETFGAIETTERFLSVPYDTMKALTSFDDIRKMYDELSAYGVDNINFVLTGYGKGGLTEDQVPYNLKWDKSVEKEMKFEELVAYAKDKGFGIYPDFDFAFVSSSSNGMFDGLTLKKHAVMTIDGRYTSKREYSATRQTYVSYFELAISPAYFEHFYTHLTQEYLEYDPIGISVSSLGSYLSSDFDEDEPYHREDSKEFTEEAFKYFDDNYNSILTSGGNAYTWKYVDHITNIATDSSRHARSSATVPFLGIVLHGYIQTAGEPINMEGNTDYAILRSIENGAALNFVLSYRNTAELKQYSDTSEYYSVRYDIWFADLVEYYTEVNDLLKDLQLSPIKDHYFLEGARVPNNDEIIKDSQNALMDAIQKEIEDAKTEKEELRLKLQAIRKNLYEMDEILPTACDALVEGSVGYKYESIKTKLTDLQSAISNLTAKEDAYKTAKENYEADPSNATNLAIMNNAQAAADAALNQMKTKYDDYKKASAEVIALGEGYVAKYELAHDNIDMLREYEAYPETIIVELEQLNGDLEADYINLKDLVDLMKDEAAEAVKDIEIKYAELLIPPVEEEKVEEVFDPYAAATNSIAYEEYENGKAFVFNFNNYAVKVQINGVYYTVGAYSYLVMN